MRTGVLDQPVIRDKVVPARGCGRFRANVADASPPCIDEKVMAILPNINRRGLLTSAATITVTGILPNITHTEALADVQIVHPKKPLAPCADVQTRNFDSVTVLRLRNILERNAIRQEAALPLLSVPKELRRMKKAADAEKFRKFADAHQEGVYDKMLAKVQRQCGDPNWAPTSMLSAMCFGAQVNRELSILYRRICSQERLVRSMVP
jgi:hypothetical protein